jgi:hypothetical protein
MAVNLGASSSIWKAGLIDTDVRVTPFLSGEALRIHVFNAALQTYQREEPSEIESWSASRLIARFQTQFPAKVVLPAIDIVLEQAAKKDKAQPLGSASIGYGKNSLCYSSRYELELFAVSPALQRLDHHRATALLKEHPNVAEYLKRFPNGLPSFDVMDFYPNSYRLRGFSSEFVPQGLQLYNSEKGAHSSGVSPMDMGLEFTIPLDLNVGLGVTGSGLFYANPGTPEYEIYSQSRGCPNDIENPLTLARSVPVSRKVPTTCSGPDGQWCSYEEESPRARLLQAIAEGCTYSRNGGAAHAVLDEESELISQMEPEQQTG